MKQANLRNGKNCYYCDAKPILRETKFGKIYECPNCKAYVSTDKHTFKPIGSLAAPELRRDRRIAHYYTSTLIKRKIKKDNIYYEEAKKALYKWLSEEIELDFIMTSIAQLFPHETTDIINIMKKYVKR